MNTNTLVEAKRKVLKFGYAWCKPIINSIAQGDNKGIRLIQSIVGWICTRPTRQVLAPPPCKTWPDIKTLLPLNTRMCNLARFGAHMQENIMPVKRTWSVYIVDSATGGNRSTHSPPRPVTRLQRRQADIANSNSTESTGIEPTWVVEFLGQCEA